MSQLASAYAVSSEEVARCASLWADQDYGAFWERLRHSEIVRGFGYSGQAIAVVSEYLQERGVGLPLNLSSEAVRTLASGGGVVSCAARTEAALTFATLSGLTAAAGELGQYWED